MSSPDGVCLPQEKGPTEFRLGRWTPIWSPHQDGDTTYRRAPLTQTGRKECRSQPGRPGPPWALVAGSVASWCLFLFLTSG